MASAVVGLHMININSLGSVDPSFELLLHFFYLLRVSFGIKCVGRNIVFFSFLSDVVCWNNTLHNTFLEAVNVKKQGVFHVGTGQRSFRCARLVCKIVSVTSIDRDEKQVPFTCIAFWIACRQCQGLRKMGGASASGATQLESGCVHW
jgi:hypothetical protein